MKHITIAVTALALIAGSAQAQKSRSPRLIPETLGFMVAGHGLFSTGVSIAGPGVRREVKTDSGEGVGLQLGYGFTKQLTAYASADVSKQNSGSFNTMMGLKRLEAGARWSFPKPGSRSVPYVSAHVGTHALTGHSDDGGLSVSIRITGKEIGAGGGLLYAVSPKIALDAGVVADYGKFSQQRLSGDVNGGNAINANNSSKFRLKVGFNWHP